MDKFINKKQWLLSPKKSDNIIEQILLNRSISRNKWSKFLNPDFSADLHNPFLLSDMDKATNRLKKAISNNEIVGIFGDYDADGIPASALLSETLENKFKLKTKVYIPTRKEGYGLNEAGIRYFHQEKVSLMITVDLGIREMKNVLYANNLGIDVIILDHHEPGEVMPEALAIINPKRKRSKYPFSELSAGGVVFKLLQAASLKLGKITQSDLKWMLDLVGITTICDMVPLIDENRLFAKFGLIVLQRTRRLGLKRLYETSAIKPEEISVYTIGFQIGPRINAPGRMDHTNESFLLLRETSPEKARELAEILNRINTKRQNELERILAEARKEIIDNKLYNKKIICISGANWSSGLVGLVAGRITEEFARPSFIFEKGEKYSKGSARSIDSFDLVEALEQTKDILGNFGGHKKAAGMTIANDKIKLLYDRLLSSADKKLKDRDLVPKIKIDVLLKVQDLKLKLADEVQKLEPYGLGNPRPIFALKSVTAENVRTIGKEDKHLRFEISGTKAIAFDWGHTAEEIKNKTIDIAFTFDEDNWDGDRKLELKIVDIRY